MADRISISNELMASIACLASLCRQRASDGNIQVMEELSAARVVCEALIGHKEFQRWVDWQAPRHIVVNAAMNGESPPVRR